MYTGTSCRSCDIRGIDDEVADLAVKDIDRDPVEIGCVVRVAINQSEAAEIGRGFQCWWAVGITDEHGEVIWNDRRRDEVCPRGEVNNSRCCGCRSLVSISQHRRGRTSPQLRYSKGILCFFAVGTYASFSTTVTSRDRGIDSRSIISDSVTCIPCQSSLNPPQSSTCRLTDSAIVIDVSEDSITGACVRSKALMRDASHPVVSLHSKEKTGKRQEESSERTHGQLRTSR